MKLDVLRFGPEALATRRRTILKWTVLVVVLAVALVIDLVTKRIAEQNLVLGEVHQILAFFALQRTANTGVAFGLLRGGGAVIIAVNILAMLIVLFYVFAERRPILGGVSGGLIIGGSLGNLVQRISAGQVTDFLKFPYWPNFNMADVFLVVGIAAIFLGLVVESVRVYKAANRETGPRD